MVSEERQYYAHSNGSDKEDWQLLIDHLHNTAQLASGFGANEDMSKLAYIAGRMHDLGKYSAEFQARLEGSTQRVDHSTAGALELRKMSQNPECQAFAELLAYCIAGHHTGLPDYGNVSDMPGESTLMGRMKTTPKDYQACQADLSQESFVWPDLRNFKPIYNKKGFPFSLSFLTRMVYSALVDADFLDTETVMRGYVPRGGYDSIPVLCERFNVFLKQFSQPKREIDRVRTETLQACIDKAVCEPGFFTLTVPTGGGKTYASLAFALNHAMLHNLQRVIYVMPFTTIIEQNAGKFKECLGAENVLEHHSNFDWEKFTKHQEEKPDDVTHQAVDKLKLASENWDIPIVVTTNVQFFESLFANRSSRARKVHNMAKSVLVFDEAQMIPLDYMSPCMYALRELVVNYGSSVVFCTATQPELQTFMPEEKNSQWRAPFTELAPEPQKLFDFYHRVDVCMLGKMSDVDLLQRLNEHAQVLCIVNTRRHAKELFTGLEGDGNFHLSTLMCPSHREQVVEEIRQRLSSGRACRVVSTSVLEAGVDLDFPVGYRALAGLDSINQAAGRVNREMKQGVQSLYVFEPDSPVIKKEPRYITQNVAVVRSVARDHVDRMISIDAIRAYFSQLYNLKDNQAFDYKKILESLSISESHFSFAEASKNFRLIEDNSVAVIIPYNQEVEGLIEELKYSLYPSRLLRKLQRYSVSIYENEFNSLNVEGKIMMVAEKYAVLCTLSDYDPQTGVHVSADLSGGDALFA